MGIITSVSGLVVYTSTINGLLSVATTLESLEEALSLACEDVHAKYSVNDCIKATTQINKVWLIFIIILLIKIIFLFVVVLVSLLKIYSINTMAGIHQRWIRK